MMSPSLFARVAHNSVLTFSLGVGPVQNLQASDVKSTSVKLTWQQPQDAAGSSIAVLVITMCFIIMLLWYHYSGTCPEFVWAG